MEAQFEDKKKQYRVIRQYRNEKTKIDYDVYMSLKPTMKRVTTIQTRHIAEGVNTSKFCVVTEDEERNKGHLEYWEGQKDVVTGLMISKRLYEREVDGEIVHLFMSEIQQNAFAIKNNSEDVAIVSDKILDFARMEYNKTQKKL